MYLLHILRSIGTRKELLLTNPEKTGWHRFGEHMDNTFLKPFMEGAWMTKHNGRYYLQWGGPGTEFSHYADGVAVSDSPLGHFKHVSLPFSMKAGGFIRGAGHGATWQDNDRNYWHVSTMIDRQSFFSDVVYYWIGISIFSVSECERFTEV